MDWTSFFSVLAAALTVAAFFIGSIRWLINTSQASLHRDICDLREDIAEIKMDMRDQGRRIDHLYEVMMLMLQRDIKPKDV